MNTDFRLSTSYFEHPKVQKLERRLGDHGVLAHIRLLRFVSQNKPDGDLSGMDAEDIAMAGGFKGEPTEFMETLVALKMLDRDGESLHVHDWHDHNPYAAHAPARAEKAKNAAKARWEKSSNAPEQAYSPVSNAKDTQPQCSEHDLALLQASFSNAPSPAPDPPPYQSKERVPGDAEPSPSLAPETEAEECQGQCAGAEYPPDFEAWWQKYPRKGKDRGSKHKSFALWRLHAGSESKREKVCRGLDIALTLDQFLDFTPAPEKWLKDRRWESLIDSHAQTANAPPAIVTQYVPKHLRGAAA